MQATDFRKKKVRPLDIKTRAKDKSMFESAAFSFSITSIFILKFVYFTIGVRWIRIRKSFTDPKKKSKMSQKNFTMIFTP